MDIFRYIFLSNFFLCNKHLLSLHAKLKGLLYPIDMYVCLVYIRTFKENTWFWIDSSTHAIEHRFFSNFFDFFFSHIFFLLNIFCVRGSKVTQSAKGYTSRGKSCDVDLYNSVHILFVVISNFIWITTFKIYPLGSTERYNIWLWDK